MGPDANKFRPDRFMDKTNMREAFAHIPFSAGPHNRVGQNFALLEEKCLRRCCDATHRVQSNTRKLKGG